MLVGFIREFKDNKDAEDWNIRVSRQNKRNGELSQRI